MDYLSLLKKQSGNKVALITDAGSYTYSDLTEKAETIRKNIDEQKQFIFIHEKTIAEQLLKFIAYSGTNVRPVIATEISKTQQFCVEKIPSEACMGVMTSGSTGKSKLLWRSYASWADFFPAQNKVFGVDENTIIFCQGSLAFTGNLNIYMSVFYVGGTVVATEKFRPKHWLKMIADYNVNSIYLIPSKLMLLPKFTYLQNMQIGSIISGSQSMGKKEAEFIKTIYPNAEITLYYGASELNYITYIKDRQMDDCKDNIGRPFDGVEVFVENEEIFVNTRYGIENITLPYSLKDRGRFDEFGNLHFLGRTDDICNVNGMKVSSQKVEQAIMQLEGVDEVAVAVMHNDTDSLVAFVGAENVITKSKIIQLLRNNLSDYEIPKHFYFLKELPKNESGKIDKMKLLAEYK